MLVQKIFEFEGLIFIKNTMDILKEIFSKVIENLLMCLVFFGGTWVTPISLSFVEKDNIVRRSLAFE
jgi:hypothetical protein